MINLRNIYVLLVLGATVTLCAEDIRKPHSFSFKQKVAELRDIFLDTWGPRSMFGIHDVSPDLKAEIYDILRKIKLNNIETIEIKRLSIIGKRFAGDKNAFAWNLPGCPRYIYVSEDWFKTLEKDEKEFLIAHEGMHLKFNHCPKGALLPIAMGVGNGSLAGLSGYLVAHRMKHNSAGPALGFATGYSLFLVGFIYGRKFFLQKRRAYELQADREAAIALNSIEGGLKLLDIWQQEEDAIEAELPQRPSLVAKRAAMRLDATQPTNKARKEALIKLKESGLIK